MKTCSKCKSLKEDKEFYRDKRQEDGLYSCCKNCHNKFFNNKKIYSKKELKLRRKYFREWERRYVYKNGKNERKKYLCRIKTWYLIKKGIIKRLPCEICGNKKSQAHHDDYDNPLSVKWLCLKHHIELHYRLKNK